MQTIQMDKQNRPSWVSASLQTFRREFSFLRALWKANLMAAMEYRAAFLAQVLGMVLNDALYFLFWVIFFNRFQAVRGWTLKDMVLVYAILTVGFGMAIYFFGNITSLADVIASGRLDYYLSLPRPVLLHILASGSIGAGLGDLSYGLLTFALAGYTSPAAIGRFMVGALLSMVLFLAVMVIVQSGAFWMGQANLLAQQTLNAILTFATYPISLFDGAARFILLTILPAAFMGAVPAEFVRKFSWSTLAQMLIITSLFTLAAVLLFYRGLRRYESGSAIQTQV